MTDVPVEDDVDLVMAMPRDQLYAMSGYQTTLDYQVLATLADDCWFALATVIAEDVAAKVVHVGLLVTNDDDQMLVAEDGSLLHHLPVSIAVSDMGAGLAGLRCYAELAADSLLTDRRGKPVLVGYLNDDHSPELRDCFIVVYRVLSDGPAPENCTWMTASSLAGIELDPAGRAVVAAQG
ncbi:MAG: hypothetical protein ACYTF0_01240 [Planctomycetota bacterium]|jgi:hypothetical protein